LSLPFFLMLVTFGAAWALSGFCKCFRCMCSSVLDVFRRMLQVLHLNVSKVDRVLHLSHRFLLPRLGVFSSLPTPAEHLSPPFFLPDVGDVRGGKGPAWACKTAREMVYRHGRLDAPSVRTFEG
jgi:hypothetical protein